MKPIDNDLHKCILYCISQPSDWNDHLNITKNILSDISKITKYFPINNLLYNFIPPIEHHRSKTLHLQIFTPTKLLIKFNSNNKFIKINNSILLNIPIKKNNIKIKFYDINKKYITIHEQSLDQLIHQQSVEFNNVGVHFSIQYLYEFDRIDMKKMFPTVTKDSYKELLKLFDVLNNNSDLDVQFILDEFCNNYNINMDNRNIYYIQLIIKLHEQNIYLNNHILENLLIIINKTNKTKIENELNILLNTFKQILSRFSFVYPINIITQNGGSINMIIRLIAKISHDNNYITIIKDCILHYIEFTYDIFKMNHEEDNIPSTSSTIAVLSQLTLNIITALINFEKYYSDEFIQYLDMFPILATHYCNKLCDDIYTTFETDLILTEELLGLYNNLVNLDTLLLKCNITNKNIIDFKKIFDPFIFKYLNKVRNKLIPSIKIIVDKDNIKQILDGYYYSSSVVDIFVNITLCINYINNFKFDVKSHKLHLLQITEDIIDEYIKCIIKKTDNIEITSKKIYICINNICEIKNQYISLQKLLNCVYDEPNIDMLIENGINQIYDLNKPYLNHYITVNRLEPIKNITDYLDEILKLASSILDVKIFVEFTTYIFYHLIDILEDMLYNMVILSIDYVKTYLDEFKSYFSNLDIPTHEINSKTKLLDQYIAFTNINNNINNINNVFLIKLLNTPLYKFIKHLNYKKNTTILYYTKCKYNTYKGHIFITSNSIDFIGKNYRKKLKVLNIKRDIKNKIVVTQLNNKYTIIDDIKFANINNDIFNIINSIL
jgi:hypothetical protein